MSNDKLTIDFLQCGKCGRFFASEREITAHQDAFARLHAFDPGIPKHDEPWQVLTVRSGERHGAGVNVDAVFVDADGDVRLRVFSREYDGRAVALYPEDFASMLSGDSAISSTATVDQARAFAASIASGLAAETEDSDDNQDPSWSLNYYINCRAHHARNGDTIRFAAEMAWLQSVISVFAAHQARLGLYKSDNT